ncbi:signal peptidase [Aspergillus niger ATCC 1015]|uniref:Signal peptidase complex subunit 1 n=1 Tax=Aspergillus niger (strain ATCC 1015 / CBS 113.46 / FGSC A1144 / LSHB Ac4 / NCTC 3858a / NRRL 328 / USDA 3528.7) TaxID=380704 RepID=G3Y4S5_ASPNA|nr:signal peptidase [Aspergillus niger ATCC 1015]
MRPPQANHAGNEVKGAPSTSDRLYRSEKEPHRASIKTFTMESLLAPIQDALEGQIDFQGQRIAELLSTVLLVLSGDIHLTLWVGLAGTLITGLAVIPPWPMYNKNPEKWLVPLTAGVGGGAGIMVDGVKVA